MHDIKPAWIACLSSAVDLASITILVENNTSLAAHICGEVPNMSVDATVISLKKNAKEKENGCGAQRKNMAAMPH